MRKILCVLLLFAAACYTPPVIQQADTSSQQKQAREVAEKLDQAAKEQSLRPDVRATIIQGRDVLNSSADSLANSDKFVNTCTDKLRECADQFKKQGSELAEYKEEAGIFGWNIGTKAKWFGIGWIVCFCVTIAALVALYLTGTIAKIASAIPIR